MVSICQYRLMASSKCAGQYSTVRVKQQLEQRKECGVIDLESRAVRAP